MPKFLMDMTQECLIPLCLTEKCRKQAPKAGLCARDLMADLYLSFQTTESN